MHMRSRWTQQKGRNLFEQQTLRIPHTLHNLHHIIYRHQNSSVCLHTSSANTNTSSPSSSLLVLPPQCSENNRYMIKAAQEDANCVVPKDTGPTLHYVTCLSCRHKARQLHGIQRLQPHDVAVFGGGLWLQPYATSRFTRNSRNGSCHHCSLCSTRLLPLHMTRGKVVSIQAGVEWVHAVYTFPSMETPACMPSMEVHAVYTHTIYFTLAAIHRQVIQPIAHPR
jgi:hypothetical protein